MKRIKLFGTGFLVLIAISLISIGFSTWIIGDGYQGNAEFNPDIGKVETSNALTFIDTELVKLCKDGVVVNEEVVDTYSVQFNFQLDVNKVKNKLDSANNTIQHDSTLIMKGCNESVNPKYFVGAKLLNGSNSEVVVNGTFSSYDSTKKEETFNGVFDLDVDLTQTYVNFSLIYNFRGNFYSSISKSLRLELAVKEILNA